MTQNELREKIRFLHIEEGISLQTIASKSGINNSHLGKWLKGSYELGENSFSKVLEAYNRFYKRMEADYNE